MAVGFDSMKSARAVAQFGSAPALGAGGRRFKSGQPDLKKVHLTAVLVSAVLLLGAVLASCGSSDSGSDAGDDVVTATDASPEDASSGEASAEGSASSGSPDAPAAPTTMAEQLDFEAMSDELPEGETDIEGVIAIAIESADHVGGDVEYSASPPAGGPHSSWWQNCGFYTEPLREELAVHSLEHGAVWVTYTDDVPADELQYLERLAEQNSHLLVSPYSQQDTAIVLSAWGRQLALDSTGDPRFVRFLQTYLRDGPTAPEPGAACFGAIGLAPDEPLALMT